MKKRAGHLYIIITLLLFNLFIIQQATASPTRLGPINGGGLKSPVKIALDNEGKIYVVEPSENRLLIYSRNGAYLKDIKGLDNPLGVAVDSSGRIYIGGGWELYGSPKGSVSVYNPDLSFSHKLGSGDGEFIRPIAIAIDKSGDTYVADCKADKIKVYSSAGAFKFSFGASGSLNGQFNFPTDIAIDDIKGEVLVSDLQVINTSNGPTAGARVQVFDNAGAFKRSFGSYGIGQGKMVGPYGLSVDSSGNIYVADSQLWVVHIFDSMGNFIGPIYDPNYPMGTPIGVKVGKDKRVFIASLTGFRVEVFGLSNYTTMAVSPSSLSFEAEEGMGNPFSQGITISNGGEGILNWTAASDSNWITLSQLSGSTGPSSSFSLLIGVNIAGLKAGTYAGSVKIAAESGATDIITVSLNVAPPPMILSIKPSALSFKAQQEGPNPPAQKIIIENQGKGEMKWAGAIDQAWLSLDATSGIAPSTVSVNVNSLSLNAGTYTGSAMITAPGAQGSPAAVNVRLKVIYAGTVKVTTNLEQAGFDITPIGIGTSYSGTGTEWSYDEVAPSDYTISFKHVSGYLKPPTRTFTVKTGREVTINGEYRTKPIATNIIAGSGGTKGKAVTALALNGEPVSTFEPFNGPVSIRVAAGDIDASGIDEIIVTDHKKSIKVYTLEGTELASLEMAEWYTKSEIAAADIDNDGKAEIIVGVKNDYDTENIQREIKLLKYDNGKIEEKGTLYTESKDKEFTIALGDINGDGIAEFLMADNDGLRSFNIDLTEEGNKLKPMPIQTNAEVYKYVPEIAAGDINDDGISEIALSIEIEGETGKKGQKVENKSLIKILNGNGEDLVTIDAFGDLGYEKPSTVALGDIDGDGKDEIIAGAGRDEHNEPLIRIFESDGTFAGTTIKAMESKFGVNVGLGRFK